ncbi:MAG: M20/M25/M40 family metallo-hydrolase [Candidatus Obscuribacterales bacterium]|nr:M20/M25/M40 family metallo-hydrolase [Candidatus Obscuribacterales bacterium]
MNVAKYVLRRLAENGARVLFGIPGTSCNALFDEAPGENVDLVVTSSELEAAYAADAYGRLRGLSAVSVSYGVGTLSLVNGIAGALVERSPVVLVNGGPSAEDLWVEQHRDVLFSHSTGRMLTDLEIFRSVTSYAKRIESVTEASAIIDEAIATALREQRPVYIEVPRDLWRISCPEPSGKIETARGATGKEDELAEKILQSLRAATNPALLLGEEISRYGLQPAILELLTSSSLPWATTLLGKSCLPEDTPGFVGVYDSDLAPKDVRAVIENSDCLLALGSKFGVDHTFLVKQSYSRIIHVLDGMVRIKEDVVQRGELAPIIDALVKKSGASRGDSTREGKLAKKPYVLRRGWVSAADQRSANISYEDLFEVIDSHLKDGWLVVADTCLGSYPAADLNVVGANSYIASPVWLSIGHSVGAAVGAASAGTKPVMVICGDGGFQMTSHAVSTLAKYDKHALVIVIDNGTYAIEQYLIDTKPFTDPQYPELPYVGLNRWDYPKLAEAFGAKFAQRVEDRESLNKCLEEALKNGGTNLISVRVSSRELPPENRQGLEISRGTAMDTKSMEKEIAQFGDAKVVCTRGISDLTASDRARNGVIHLKDTGNLRVVVQKGRSFQRLNPHVPVIVDRGRFLVVDLPNDQDVKAHSSCYGLVPKGAPEAGYRVQTSVPQERNETIVEVLQRITAENLESKVKGLSEIHSRYSLLPNFETALALAESWLLKTGVTISRQLVPMAGGQTANLIGTKTGMGENRSLFIICAHLDSVNHDDEPNGRAPGADDNATGSATVIAIAEAVADVSLLHDVRFVLFGGEEQNLFGSEAYVNELSDEDKARLLGVINIDMAGSNNGPVPAVLLEGSEVSRSVMEKLAQAAATYTNLQTKFSFDPYASDHVPFINKGLPGVLTIEGNDTAYAHEHTDRDTVDKLDFELHREITRMNLAWLLEQALASES